MCYQLFWKKTHWKWYNSGLQRSQNNAVAALSQALWPRWQRNVIKIHIKKHRQFPPYKDNHGKTPSELVLMDRFEILEMVISNLKECVFQGHHFKLKKPRLPRARTHTETISYMQDPRSPRLWTQYFHIAHYHVQPKATISHLSVWRSSWKCECFCRFLRSECWDRNLRRSNSPLFQHFQPGPTYCIHYQCDSSNQLWPELEVEEKRGGTVRLNTFSHSRRILFPSHGILDVIYRCTYNRCTWSWLINHSQYFRSSNQKEQVPGG